MFNYKKTCSTCCLGLASLLLLAMPLGTLAASAEEIARINEDVAVLAAQLAEAEMRTKIATQKNELVKLNAPQPKPAEILPVVSAIEGMDGRLIATLITETGVKRAVVKGDKVGKWTVSKIGVNTVLLKQGKRSIDLAFGNVPPKPAAPPAARPAE